MAVCDDGGPGHASSVCALGTDCDDCGQRVVIPYAVASHRLLQSSPNPVANGGVPICTCCAAFYWKEGGRVCSVVPLWELSDWTCTACSSLTDLPRDQFCGKVSERSRASEPASRFVRTSPPPSVIAAEKSPRRVPSVRSCALRARILPSVRLVPLPSVR